ncbi:hypothetical protein GCM10011492_21740 [Flexivirga endophytica]|uniref:Uncharacterized protein n=1 Tax=Flexivirga endophytica TaxID=1849103 RepID=A0A916T4E3_9MICO|nr:hypothetical protein [Flexivirga endophytica]GGB30877.1 hypothetical protein GCM10011492_21740 [Flexivirga endophytica]GHB51802.1 hypothetical protein GCM10008112_21010 [Flexivirga endophytica]
MKIYRGRPTVITTVGIGTSQVEIRMVPVPCASQFIVSGRPGRALLAELG